MARAGTLAVSLRPSFASLLPALRQFGLRGWSVAAATAVVSALALGAPTVMYGQPWPLRQLPVVFVRMTPVRAQDYGVWLLSAALLGLIAGAYVQRPTAQGKNQIAFGGVGSYLAIGCPVCNKAVVLLLGVSGALNIFGPTQIIIGALSVLTLGWTLLLRTTAITAPDCPLPGVTA